MIPMCRKADASTPKSSHVYPGCVRWHHPSSSRRYKSLPSLKQGFTPPISLPFAPSNTTGGASVHRTRPVRKSYSIHTSDPSAFPTPHTPSSPPPLPVRSSPPPIINGELATHPPTSSKLSFAFPRQTSPISQGRTAHVILPPRRWDSLPLTVKTELALQEVAESDSSLSSPSESEPPSPATAKRNQYSKLRRHLGASIPPELVYKDKAVDTTSPWIAPVLEYVPEDGLDSIYVIAGEDHDEEEISEESESEESGESEELEIRWEPPPDTAANEPSRDGYCGRWMREQGGRRWLMNDYQDVVQALRDL